MISASQVTVAATATRLSPAPADAVGGSSVAVKNTSAVTVYLGGAAVTSATGYPLAVGETFTIDLGNTGYVKGSASGSSQSVDEILYGVVATGTAVVAVIGSGI